MGIEGLVILLVVVLIIIGYYGNGRWYGNRSGTVAPGGGFNIIGLLLTVLVAVIILVLIFAVLGGGFHIGTR